MASMNHRHFLINRFDHFYDSINNKANVFLAINTFLIGGLFTALTFLPSYLKDSFMASFWIIFMLALNIASILFTLISLLPYSNTCGESLVFFGDISRMDVKTFMQKLSTQQDHELSVDLDQQIFYLSKGLNKKFRNLSIAGAFFFVEALLVVPLIISVIINLK